MDQASIANIIKKENNQILCLSMEEHLPLMKMSSCPPHTPKNKNLT